MKFYLSSFRLVKISTFFWLLFSTSSMAQVIPDQTLPTNSEVTPSDNANVVTEGTKAGNNLFHSFEQFSIPQGDLVLFKNALDIENIFSRVTGESISNIEGAIRANGSANLFLINPNGIIFGPDARLDIGGSFFGSTAESVIFDDSREFSATEIEENPILKISVPIGLRFEDNSGDITVRGTGSNLQFSPSEPFTRDNSLNGLSVKPDKTLALVGGGLILEGGIVSAQEGRIELGSVEKGTVDLNLTNLEKVLSYENVPSFKNILLSQKALVDAGDSIQLQGNNIAVSDGSLVFLQTANSSRGSLKINATETITLEEISVDRGAFDDSPNSALRTETVGQGNGVNIDIYSKNIIIRNGAGIFSRNYTSNPGGSLSISASESFQLVNNANAIASNFSTGKASDINIETRLLELQDGGSVSSLSRGTGDSGNVTINVIDSIELINSQEFIEASSESNTFLTSLSSTTFGDGNAGNLIINTPELLIGEKSGIATSTFSSGNAGNVEIAASESVQVTGLISSSSVIADPTTQEIFNVPSVPSGSTGEINIDTERLSLTDGGIIRVINEGKGNAGVVQINSEFTNLNGNSSITANTASGDGGNIVINTDNLIALDSSDITANSFGGNGGNIDIDARGVFLSFNSQIDASSKLGIDGTVQINAPDITLQPELEQLELKLVTTDEAIANSCLARSNQQGSFTIGDNGGMQKNPNSNYSDANFSLTGVGLLPTTSEQPSEIQESDRLRRYAERNRQLSSSTIPAQRMVKTESGRIFLVAAPQKAESVYCQTKAEGRKQPITDTRATQGLEFNSRHAPSPSHKGRRD